MIHEFLACDKMYSQQEEIDNTCEDLMAKSHREVSWKFLGGGNTQIYLFVC